MALALGKKNVDSRETLIYFMTAIDSDAPDNSEKANLILRLTSRESITALQIQTLMSALTVLGSLRYRAPVDPVTASAPELDGGVASAMDVSMIKICDRLDTLVAEPTRWDLKIQCEMEAQLQKIYATHLEALEAQKEAFEDSRAPHKQLKPNFFRLEGNKWAAVIGNISDQKNAIVGIGGTPAEAMLDMETKFYQGDKQQS